MRRGRLDHKRPALRVGRLALLLSVLIAGCATRPTSLPQDTADQVIVKTARIPDTEPWVSRFAQHSWIDIKGASGWRRVEILSATSGVKAAPLAASAGYADERWGRPVHVLANYSGAQAARIGTAILERAQHYPQRDDYRAWPGPNSNTFIEWLAGEVRGLRFELYPNAVGKDYGGWGRAGVTSTGTGVELETAIVGVQLGLREGLELHFIGLTLGVGFWPPRLKLPFLASVPFGY